MPGISRSSVRAAILDALALVSPVECAGCGAPDRSLCDVCRLALVAAPDARELPGIDRGVPVLAALRYEGIVRKVIIEFKQNDRTGLARALAVPFGRLVRSVLGDASVVVVPVPPGRASSRRRGYDPVALLVKRAGIRRTHALRLVRSGSGQKLLGIDARQSNRAGSMRASNLVRGRRVILVDDVITTGATVVEAARAITASGGSIVAIVALASTPRRTDFV